MKKTFLILFFGLLVNVSFSQEVKSMYRFKKVKEQTFKGTEISYLDQELDSLVLYKNAGFYRRTSYAQFDNFGSEEQKGQWKIDNGILYLNITAKKENFAEENWTEYTGKFKYSIKRKNLIPINDSFEIYATRKLKLIE